MVKTCGPAAEASVAPGPPAEEFRAFFEQHHALALNYARRRLGDRELAEEVVSAAFVRMLNGFARFRTSTAPPAAWVYRVVTNEIRRHMRATRRYRLLLADWAHSQRRSASTSHDGEPAVDFDSVRRALERLPEKYASVLALRYFEQQSVYEIALILELTESAVRTRIQRGLAQLRRRLARPVVADGPGEHT